MLVQKCNMEESTTKAPSYSMMHSLEEGYILVCAVVPLIYHKYGLTGNLLLVWFYLNPCQWYGMNHYIIMYQNQGKVRICMEPKLLMMVLYKNMVVIFGVPRSIYIIFKDTHAEKLNIVAVDRVRQ